MTTAAIPAVDSEYDGDLARSVALENYAEPFGTGSDGLVGTSKNGTYNIVARDYGDHQVNYYIPKGSEDEYGMSEFEQLSLGDERPLPTTARMMQQRAYPQYDMYNREVPYGYGPGMPMMPDYYAVPPPPPVEYIYDDQPPPIFEQQEPYVVDDGHPEIIYVAEPRAPQQPIILQQPTIAAPIIQPPVYIQPEAQQAPVHHTFVLQPPGPAPAPIQRTVTVQPEMQEAHTRHTFVLQTPAGPPQPPIVIHHPAPPQPQRTIVVKQPPPPVRRVRRRVVVPRTPTPEPIKVTRRVVVPRTPTPEPVKVTRRIVVRSRTPTPDPPTPPPPPRKVIVPRPPRTPSPVPERRRVVRSPPQPTPRKVEDPGLSLKDVVAQNRARRGNRMPKPKREVHEELPYDLPTYHRDTVKNGFMVHRQRFD